ncbi:unnamed protein product [Trichogramma brassicae]|uniref:Uncharacterized protein n=1 Tax=Trichogramma brassicae TaxID=86971 RepID=A0A6H5IUZ7_9HYME|nr:unnamed protein product [Trichogramma brassicae]
MIAASDTYILSPELLGPIFKNPNINFRQNLQPSGLDREAAPARRRPVVPRRIRRSQLPERRQSLPLRHRVRLANDRLDEQHRSRRSSHYGHFNGKSFSLKCNLKNHIEAVFEATECKTIDELERTVIKNVGQILRSEELCYLNEMLTVRFKLSARYIADSDNERHCKRIDIFTRILKLHDSKRCIVLDDAHNMDPMSWEFLKRAMNDKNIVLVMAILVSKRSNDVSQIELAPYNDERLFRHRLEELETRYLPALVCQFMNVHGFSQELYK